jgi:hypothetical protein
VVDTPLGEKDGADLGSDITKVFQSTFGRWRWYA